MIERMNEMENKSDIYRVTDCPVPTGLAKHHEELDALLNLIPNLTFNLKMRHC